MGSVIEAHHHLRAGAPLVPQVPQQLVDRLWPLVVKPHAVRHELVNPQPEHRVEHDGHDHRQGHHAGQGGIDHSHGTARIHQEGVVANGGDEGQAQGHGLAWVEQARGDDLDAAHDDEGGDEHEYGPDHRRRQQGPEGGHGGKEGEADEDATQGKAHDATGDTGRQGQAEGAAAGGLGDAVDQRAGGVGQALGHETAADAGHVRALPTGVVGALGDGEDAKAVEGERQADEEEFGQEGPVEGPAELADGRDREQGYLSDDRQALRIHQPQPEGQ